MRITETKLRSIIKDIILENEGKVSHTALSMYSELQKMLGNPSHENLQTESVGGAVNLTLGALGKGLTLSGGTMLAAGLLQYAGVDLTAITPEHMEALLTFMEQHSSKLDGLATAAIGAMTLIPGATFSGLSDSSKLK